MSVQMTNNAPALFLKWCEEAHVQPTRRQYAKWVRGEGAAISAASHRAGHDKKLRKALEGRSI